MQNGFIKNIIIASICTLCIVGGLFFYSYTIKHPNIETNRDETEKANIIGEDSNINNQKIEETPEKIVELKNTPKIYEEEAIINPPVIPGSKKDKVLICGGGKNHDEAVGKSFQKGYASYNGEEYTGEIIFKNDMPRGECFQYAGNNQIEIVIRSTTNAGSASLSIQMFPSIALFMPAGSNSFEHIFNGVIPATNLIVTGAGREHNETAYSIEFFSEDPINPEKQLASFSNGFIAGQLVYIAEKRGISVDEARIIAQKTASNSENFNDKDGFGKISIEKALAY